VVRGKGFAPRSNLHFQYVGVQVHFAVTR
jgi:hypothetical protein